MAVYERHIGDDQIIRHHTEDGSEDDARMRGLVAAEVDGWAVLAPKRTRAKKADSGEGDGAPAGE